MDDLSLAADFPAATREQWLTLVEGVLKGADFSKKLVGRTHDGIALQPLYPKAEGAGLIAREEPGRWRVSQRV
ncbi:methylmalonyl-CoA mutase, partial [Microvirga sp. 2YAF29]